MKPRKLMQGKLQMVAIIAVSVMSGMLVSACGTAKKSAKAGTEAQTVQEVKDYTADKKVAKKLKLDEVYESADKLPEFPGGWQALMKYLADNVQYPVEAQKKGIQGRVITQMVIGKDGKIYNPKVMRSVHPLLDNEALRVINGLPPFKPAEMNDGTKVNMKFNIPINFIPRK